jgi:hypothetical protein
MIEIIDDEVELIRLRVAEKLGWRAIRYGGNSALVGLPPGKKRPGPVPSYARDIKASWEIVDYLTALEIRVSIVNETLRGYIRNYFVEIGPKEVPFAKASHRSTSVAICLAFLDVPEEKLRSTSNRPVTLDSGDFIHRVT